METHNSNLPPMSDFEGAKLHPATAKKQETELLEPVVLEDPGAVAMRAEVPQAAESIPDKEGLKQMLIKNPELANTSPASIITDQDFLVSVIEGIDTSESKWTSAYKLIEAYKDRGGVVDDAFVTKFLALPIANRGLKSSVIEGVLLAAGYDEQKLTLESMERILSMADDHAMIYVLQIIFEGYRQTKLTELPFLRDAEALERLVRKFPSFYKECSDYLKIFGIPLSIGDYSADKRILLTAMDLHGPENYRFCDPTLWQDREIALKAVGMNSDLLTRIPNKLKNDPEILAAASKAPKLGLDRDPYTPSVRG